MIITASTFKDYIAYIGFYILIKGLFNKLELFAFITYLNVHLCFIRRLII